MGLKLIITACAAGISGLSAIFMLVTTWRIKTAQVWKEEAEAQKARAERLLSELSEINKRLTDLEKDYDNLVRLLVTLDPNQIASLRRS